MSRAYLAFTEKGMALAHRLARALPGSVSRCGAGGVRLAEWTSTQFAQADALIFVGAVGIAVRAIAPHCKSKATDPAVVVLDECGRFAVPLLSGHLGGANALARALAEACGAIPVITTATDANGVFAVDEWAKAQGCAVLGAPLAHDFCVISLSDRLTPWEVIETRLACAARGDFALALYNPSSKGRPDYLQKAVRILLANGKTPETVCGIVRNIGREGQEKRVLTLAELEKTQVDMFTTVFIGNAATRELAGRMVTPRGYKR